MPRPESIAYMQHYESCPVCKKVALVQSADSEEGLCPIGKDLRWKAILSLIRQRDAIDADPDTNNDLYN